MYFDTGTYFMNQDCIQRIKDRYCDFGKKHLPCQNSGEKLRTKSSDLQACIVLTLVQSSGPLSYIYGELSFFLAQNHTKIILWSLYLNAYLVFAKNGSKKVQLSLDFFWNQSAKKLFIGVSARGVIFQLFSTLNDCKLVIF